MLIHEIEAQGAWLFRWRSYVPLVLGPLAVWELSTHDQYLANSITADFAYKVACLLVALTGLGVRFAVHGYALEGSSGRNTRAQIATHLNTAGMYSVVRNPLYLGNIIMVLGIMLFTKSLMVAVAALLFYLLFYERIIATEERFLSEKFGAPYEEWAKRAPALWPRWSHWTYPDHSFSWKRGIRAEFYGLTAVVGAMTVMDTLDVWFIERVLAVNPFWLALFVLSMTAFIILRHLRKNTDWLERDNPTAEPYAES